MKVQIPLLNVLVRMLLISFFFPGVLLFHGCVGAILVAGAGAGAYTYVKGSVNRIYYAGYQQSIDATEKTLNELKIRVTGKTSDALKTVINGERADETPVHIEIEVDKPEFTLIAVRTGVFGYTSRKASEKVHQYIGKRLKKRTSQLTAKTSAETPATSQASTTPKPLTKEPLPKASANTYMPTKPPQTDTLKTGSSPTPIKNPLFIYYDSDEKGIPSEAYPILEQVTRYMIERPATHLHIRGYTDSIGNKDNNLIISQKRVEAIKSYLIARGIDAGRINAVGYGARNFIASNKTDKLRALNRRVELQLY
jgi:outer membrane protein OmpA-like peptidoglycan-associated protein